MLGLGGNQAPMNNGALNLGVQNQQMQMPMQSQNPWANQQVMSAGQAPIMQGMFGGQQNQFTQQPVTPPTELEIQIMLLRGISPIERFVASPQMGTLVEMFSTLVSFSVLKLKKVWQFEPKDSQVPENVINDVYMCTRHVQDKKIKSEFLNNLKEISEEEFLYFLRQLQQKFSRIVNIERTILYFLGG